MLRNRSFAVLGLCSLSLFAGCGSEDSGIYGSGMNSGSVEGREPDPMGGQGGTLTAGDWDDNLNFSLYQKYVAGYRNADSSIPVIPTGDRVIIKVVSDSGDSVSNALVKVAGTNQTYLTAPTGTDGQVLFFPQHDGAVQETNFTVTVDPPPGQTGIDPVSQAAPMMGADWTITLPGAQKNLPLELDLAFVIDATGSMGDELDYLKVEVQGIADRIQSEFQTVSIRYALVMYRDHGDAYITQKFDFTSDLAAFKQNLDAQKAEGGGDTPEAMDEAMQVVPELSWSSSNTARMSFLLADAPPHKETRAAMLEAINALRPMGVKLFPIAASGVDTEAEFLMRVGAQATQGRYLFLTDDSGVGNAHAEPTIPCYHVQKLNDLVFRVIASELTGERVEAAPAEILRSVGEPVEGVCTLKDGSFAYL